MLTLLFQLAQAPAGGTDGLFRAPSIYTMVSLATTFVLAIILWRRIVMSKPVTSRQYERFAARLDAFELNEQQRDKMDVDFRHHIIEANGAQLKATKDQNSLLEKLLRRTEYVASTLESRPCLVNPIDTDCPEGYSKK